MVGDYVSACYDPQTDRLVLQKGKKQDVFTLHQLLLEADSGAKKGGLSRHYWGSVWVQAKEKAGQWIVLG